MVDGPVPDTAMDTKSEDGDPGSDIDTAPLTADERAMLERLRGSGAAPDETAEDGTPGDETPENETTLPGAPPPAGPPDPLDAVFREPD